MPELLKNPSYSLSADLFLVSNNISKAEREGGLFSPCSLLAPFLSLLTVDVVAEIHSFRFHFPLKWTIYWASEVQITTLMVPYWGGDDALSIRMLATVSLCVCCSNINALL